MYDLILCPQVTNSLGNLSVYRPPGVWHSLGGHQIGTVEPFGLGLQPHFKVVMKLSAAGSKQYVFTADTGPTAVRGISGGLCHGCSLGGHWIRPVKPFGLGLPTHFRVVTKRSRE
jgi:hypothetical protein